MKCVHYGTERRAEQARQAQGAGHGCPRWRASMALLRPRPRRGAPEGQGVAAAPCSDFFRRRSARSGEARFHLLPRCQPIQTLAWTVVEEGVDPSQFLLAKRRERGLLGVDPANQPVGVLVGSPLPGVVGTCEEHVGLQLPRDVFVTGELLAVVEGDPVDGNPGFHEEIDDHQGNRVRLLAGRPPHQGEAGNALHQRHQVATGVFPDNQIAFPMPDLDAKLHFGGARLDAAPTRDHAAATPALPGAATLALALGARQIRPKDAALLGICVDVLVDCLLADVLASLQARAFADDLWRPSLHELLLGILADGFGEAPGSGPLRPLVGKRLRLLGTVPSLPRVSLQFAADRARWPIQQASDRVVPDSFLPPLPD